MEVAQQDGERTGLAFQFVAVGQALQIEIGACQQFFQDEALGYVAEVLPVRHRSDGRGGPTSDTLRVTGRHVPFLPLSVDVTGVFFQA